MGCVIIYVLVTRESYYVFLLVNFDKLMKGDYVSENGLCNTASGLFLSLLLQGVKAHTNLTPRIVRGMGFQFRDSERTEIIPQINLSTNLALKSPYKRLPWT